MQINDLHGFLWDRADLNRRHTDFQSVALPTELQSRWKGDKDTVFAFQKQYMTTHLLGIFS